ncbi:hypothetical protein [Bradyrhizobium prioriisuperbiae]|uniref:hypothetical protein n=1 Tax=Bradyrhizobium prioriisuperbiae TaxID=2854389 RepID=UPI0028EFE15C|nr:hypothetical protein [Bradyrhizobium prioritasuperba]
MRDKKQSGRSPLTTGELEQLKADDFVRLKLTEDEKARLRQINEARRWERLQRSARLRVEEQPILADLHDVGLSVRSVWDLVNTSTKYSEAVPVLLRHLLFPYSDRIREGIARALAIPDPEVRKAWSTLVEEYRKAPAGWGVIARGDTKEYRLGAKGGLACALAVAVSDETLPELIAIAKDRSQGETRVLLLSALRKSKSSLAKQAIEELASDPDLAKEISSWRKPKR